MSEGWDCHIRISSDKGRRRIPNGTLVGHLGATRARGVDLDIAGGEGEWGESSCRQFSVPDAF